jgi:hypothetical protein
MFSGEPYALSSPPEREVMSELQRDCEETFSPFKSKFTVLKFNSGSKLCPKRKVLHSKQAAPYYEQNLLQLESSTKHPPFTEEQPQRLIDLKIDD